MTCSKKPGAQDHSLLSGHVCSLMILLFWIMSHPNLKAWKKNLYSLPRINYYRIPYFL